MRNIFILYIPPGNHEAVVHYEDTIKKKVSQVRIFKYLDQVTRYKLQGVFGNRDIAVWGSRDSDANRSKFEKMSEGDDLLIVEGDTIKLLGKIAAKAVNPDLSRELWKNLKGETSEGWNLIYFIANPVEIELPFSEFTKLFNYMPNFQLRGFSTVAEQKLQEFYGKYDDLYSILVLIKSGQGYIEKPIAEIPVTGVAETPGDYIVPEAPEVPVAKEMTEHLAMQWKLVNLGLKAGSKVWVPPNNQTQIRQVYDFTEFEEKFTSGLDINAKYVENIDVVWKEEFRIDSAFEIENSTSIYSGLLRFSDLKIVAPNTTYPLFIVAPSNRKNRVIEQLKRPTFQKLDFNKKVRFLSYEAVNEVDRFFANSTSGLNVELLEGKSELLEVI